MRKWLIVLLSVLVMFGFAGTAFARNLGTGGPPDWPGAFDSNDDPETGADSTNYLPGEGAIEGVLSLQQELGTDPAGTKPTVKAYLTTEHDADGEHSTVTATSVTATTVNASTTLQIGGTSFTATATEINTVCDGVLSGSDTWDPASIADGNEEAKEVTVTGAVLGDYALGSFSLDVEDLVLNCQITTSDTAACVLANNTGGAIDLASGTIKVMLLTQ